VSEQVVHTETQLPGTGEVGAVHPQPWDAPPTPVAERLLARAFDTCRFTGYGRTTKVVGLVIQAVGVDVSLGELCRVHSLNSDNSVMAEVVGFHEGGILLMPLGELDGVHPGSAVEPMGRSWGVEVGDGLLGRILDGLGNPMDGLGDVGPTVRVPLNQDPPNPLTRRPISEPLPTGVRALDGMIPVGSGQRIGIFAGSGVGKSTLLGMIARHARADVNVIALLGERGREVRDFIEHSLGPEGLARSVLVVATGDQSALVRARGALVATAIAEHFRDQGKQVMLMVDSVTRVAMAWREIGLAVGEPPTTKGYPPSVFAALPRLLERAGNGPRGGITGIYTVLVEGDDFNEPVADHVRSVLDGHVVLTRALAAQNHFPAIDVLQSASRVRDHIAPDETLRAASRIQSLIAARREKDDLIAVGAYEPGSHREVDAALALEDRINGFLRQPPNEAADLRETRRELVSLALESMGGAA
jgi:FliI/YscN family ATPase